VPGPAGHDGPAGPIAARPRLSQPSAQQTRGRLVRDEPGHGRTVAARRRVRHRRHDGVRSGTTTTTTTTPTTTTAAAATEGRRQGRRDRGESRATVHAPAAVHQLTQAVSV